MSQAEPVSEAERPFEAEGQMAAVRIGVVGDFNPEFVTHTSTDESLMHSAAHLGIPIEIEWLPTPSLVHPEATHTLTTFDGLWISAGSPYRDRDGAFAAIRFAREHGWPMVAT